MKTKLLVTALVTAGLSLGMLSGCGGGGGSSDGDAPAPAPESEVELNAATSESLAMNAAEALPGCSYVSDTTITSSTTLSSAYAVAIEHVADLNDQVVSTRTVSTREATPISDTIAGSCPIADPGELTIVGTHEDGVDDVTYTFTNFCTGDAVESMTIHGTADGIPSDTGPIPQYTEISTGSSGISLTEVGTEGTFTHVVTLTNARFDNANGDESATVDDQNTISADLLSVLDGRSNTTFEVTNANISSYVSDTNDVFVVTNITYTDPETGVVNISTTPIVINEDSVMTSGVITVSGANGTSMSMTLDDTVENSFNVVFDGETIGVMNCSELAAGDVALP
ncbi:MAG: hypothetical protein U9R28_08340 [Pseudomonadota bacterium]|nr:hypothetical protein [Pseudomonadota bacterium]